MDDTSEYIHIIPSLEVYPRISYFHNRYTDILGKLKKITGKYANLFEKERQDIPNSPFDNGIELRVIGESDISPERFIPVESRLYEVNVSRREGIGERFHVDRIVAVDPFKNYAYPGSSGVLAHDEAMDTSISVGECSLTVTICNVTIQRLDREDLEKVTQLLRQVSSKSSDKLQHCFLLCGTYHQFTEAEKDTFKRQIEHEIGTLLPLQGIVIGTGNVCIKDEISMFLETECVRKFIYLKNVLQEYTNGQRKSFLAKPLLETKTVKRPIKRFLLKVGELVTCEPETNVEEKLSNVVKCLAVIAFSEKYNLQVWICNGIVNTYTFQHKLEQSFSDHTLNGLKKIIAIAKEPATSANKVDGEKIIYGNSKNIMRNLRKDSEGVLSDVEKYLSQFSSAVRKMQLEITCCLKKSSVPQLLSETDKERSSPVLGVDLRKDILRIDGVYGVGTIYGQLEIHTNPGTDVTAVESEIRKLMGSKSHVYQFAVRTLDTKPEIYVDGQYENGETIESLSPLRRGTLGGFVNGSDNRLYGLTCAHVVKSHFGQESNVFIKDSQNRQCLFAKSFPNLTVSTGEAAKPLIDIAAVRIVDHMADKCVKFLKNDNGRIQPAVLAADRPSDLAGIYVYKHGAMSGLTKGLVCSDDYSVINDEDDGIEYIMLIDNYSDNVNGDTDDVLFAIPGDSGSTVCTPNQNDVNIINTVGVLSAGKFKPTGYDIPLYFSFRLYDGLRKLTSKAGGLQFNFPQVCI